MNRQQTHVISGKVDGLRIESRILEEQIQEAVEHGHRTLEIKAFGQHGIGGRLWKANSDRVHVKIDGHPGQRTGSMGFPNTLIEIFGPASDDVGWLNAGATIVVHGNAGNGAANAMAQGKIYVAGNIGARGMTMTKYNPRFEPPELWVLGSVGDYFGEFMAGGIAVVCGHRAQNPKNVIGYRPFVGMVGGKVYFRGPHSGYSEKDAKLTPLTAEDWEWLVENMRKYLEHIQRSDLFDKFSVKEEWQLLVARTPQEKAVVPMRPMKDFRENVWDKELGKGGLIGDLIDMDMSPIPVLANGDMRRYVPVWENRTFLAPCEAGCPTGMPVHERWRLIREGRVDEAVDLALAYTPFPATVCGYLCPNLCMQECTRHSAKMTPVDVTQLGKASIKAGVPDIPPLNGKKVAVIGGGPAGISVAWQLRQNGYDAVIYDRGENLGGKISSSIPTSRIPKEVIEAELERVKKVIPQIHLKQDLNQSEVERLKTDYDFIVIAAGAQKPRILNYPGSERLVTALDFLKKAKTDSFNPGERVVIIGAGNVGCDVATEAHRLGAKDILLIDIQEPLSFGKERKEAEAAGAKFRYPCFTKEITDEGVVLDTGELLPANTVFISIGDVPDLDFLPANVEIERGFIKVDDHFQTSDPQIFAIGDAVKPGLLTDAIGSGRKAAQAMMNVFKKGRPTVKERTMIDKKRITLEYFDPRIASFDDIESCGAQCSSCGACRDCGVCVSICPRTAISRRELAGNDYEYVVDPEKCIGCGFCAGACPCGVWNLIENEPIG